MTKRLRKPMLWLGTAILVMQAVFMPIGRVYAETTSDTEEQQEQVELPASELIESEIHENDVSYINNERDKEGLNIPQEKNNTSYRDSIDVTTGAQFEAAMNNPNITQINLAAPITVSRSFTISRSLEINGNGFPLTLGMIRVSGTNVELKIRNSRIGSTNSSPGANTSWIVIPIGAVAPSFIFSDVSFFDTNRLVGPNDRTVQSKIIFDGGINTFGNRNSTDSLFGGAYNIELINDSIVKVEDKGFVEILRDTPTSLINSSSVMIEDGSILDIRRSPKSAFETLTINVSGVLNCQILGDSFNEINSTSNQPFRINISNTGVFNIRREASNLPGPVIKTNRNGFEITIENGATYDIFNDSSQGITDSIAEIDTFKISTKHLSFWDVGYQNDKKASLVFEDFQASLSGNNSSIIDFSNNERFNRVYDSSGLSAYSRMSSSYNEEIERTVVSKYLDTAGNEISDSETIKGLLGNFYQTTQKDIGGYKLTEVPINHSGYFKRDKIEVIYVYEITNLSPTDPLDPEIEVDPENKPELPEGQGLLSIDFVSSFNFGSQAISAHDQTYYAQPQRLLNEDQTVNEDEERPNYIQVSDRRSENERNGWQLAVTQKEQFQTENSHELAGAQLQLMNQQLVTAQGGKEPSLQATNPLKLVPGNKRTLVRAEGAEGTGTWLYRFGNAASAGESVALHVPKGATPEAKHYTTTLIWELSAVPRN
ncbi:WxL domain-containing protein [Enterococcus casseliflavus]|uniref:WxL domain-containing protein n=1 Tax=Enterococcus casseliflavus TaxID=37734 RepID=UPI0039A783CB